MANFFDDLGNAFKKLANDVSTEVSVTAKEQKAKEAFQKLGRMHYQAVCKGEAPGGPEFDQQVLEIRQLLQQIKDLKDNAHVTSAEDFEA
ncbi:MAG: hypothetical protein E7438_02645 [Ruminococcaceae bacterium]|nr:hypothetical protein [Oscillospiraceae bacterium]